MNTKEVSKTNEQSTFPAQTAGMLNLPDLEAQMNKLWNMFLQQTERNNQLMTIIKQQQEMKINLPAAIEVMPSEIKQEATHYSALEVPELSFTKIKQVEPLMRLITKSRRADGVHALIEFLHTLFYIKGEAYIEQVFGLMGIPESTGYRLKAELRRTKLISMSRGVILMTDLGRRVYTGEITIEEINKIKFPSID